MPRRQNLSWTIAKGLMSALKLPSVRQFVNREYTDYLATCVPPRPHGFSLWSPEPAAGDLGRITDYISWPSVTDHAFSARHLAPVRAEREMPDPPKNPRDRWDGTTELWRRRGPMIESRSSALFAFFAQWFTDSILRIDSRDRRRNTSTHNIDLCQIYGQCWETTALLQSKDPDQRGELAHRVVDDEEYPDRLCEETSAGIVVRKQYHSLPYVKALDVILKGFPEERKLGLYATGLDRGNSSIGYVAISTLFLREHNRLARKLVGLNPRWGSEQVFQTARNINIVILLKLLLAGYINHILGEELFLLEPGFAERRAWYRPNWMALEFDLLYRWHGLVPDKIRAGGEDYLPDDYRNNNQLFESLKLGPTLEALTRTPAGKIGLANTPEFLLPAEYQSLRVARKFRLASYNDYCKHFKLAPLRSFDELTDAPEIVKKLAGMYKSVDDLEYLVGIFAESPDKGVLFGRLMARMVAYDALTQIYSNPLISGPLYTVETFTEWGLETIERTTSLDALVERNVRGGAMASFSHRKSDERAS
jgi:prostaglandin-endoperoxide synthase 2